MKIHKLKRLFFIVLISLIEHSYGQVTSFSYENPPSGVTSSNCLFNLPNNPPIPFGGLNHYGVVGGVDYTGTELVLPTSGSGNGTAYRINYNFDPSKTYKILIEAKASAGTEVLQYALSQYTQTTAPSSCSPGFSTIITQNADKTSSTTNMSQDYVQYVAFDNYKPSNSNIKYLLIGDYNTTTTIGNVQIKSVTIIADPGCGIITITKAFAFPGSMIVQYDLNGSAQTVGAILTYTSGGVNYSTNITNLGFVHPSTSNYAQIFATSGRTYTVTLYATCISGSSARYPIFTHNLVVTIP